MSAAWKTLANGDGSTGMVLAVDFDASGRQEARFSDLVPNLRSDAEFRETVPPETARGGAGYVEHWARPLEAARVPVRAVLGYCAGSVYAAALADRIAAWQREAPELVLFDPELSVPQTLVWQYYKVVGIMAAHLPHEEIEVAREAGRREFDRLADVGTLGDALVDLVRKYGDRAFAAAGLDPSRREELFGVFADFMRYLAFAGEIEPLDRWRTAVAFSSRTPMSGLRGMRADGRTIEVAREIEVGVDHAGLLADPAVAAEVSALLGAPPRHAGPGEG